MKVLVIPDVHLKPWMFEQAAMLMKKGTADLALCLMDIADDWKQQYNLDLYEQSYDAAISFAEGFPDTLWCYGNHDICYEWNQRETGYSPIGARLVCEKLRKLREAVPNEKQVAFIHRIDNVLFMHGGLRDGYVRHYVPSEDYDDIDAVVRTINGFGYTELWHDLSPLWLRPQYNKYRMYKSDTLLQVVGHTPLKAIQRTGNVISCDVFSTDSDRKPVGTEEYLVLDTETWEYQTVKP